MTDNPYLSQWTPSYLQALWKELEHQIHPFTQVLSIEGRIFRQLDEAGKRFFAHKFMYHTLETVMFCRDGTVADRWFLGPPRYFLSGGGLIIHVQDSEPFWTLPAETRVQTATLPTPQLPPQHTKIPRPPNAYILYRKERHNMVKAANPGISNNEISQILGRAWNLESREIRQKYKEMAEHVKQALLEKHPDYQYKPRKPNEKKRRVRRGQDTLAQGLSDTNTVLSSSPDSNSEPASSVFTTLNTA
ncbi:MAT1-2-1 like protein [Paramyrothecium foliicola]|nr:MAT1-2-1 like protein [Paramyrothecium foliicola]